MNTITRHKYGLTDRLHPPKVTRYENIVSFGPAMAGLEAERKNPGFTAHEAHEVDDLAFRLKYPRSGLKVWRVELWKNS